MARLCRQMCGYLSPLFGTPHLLKKNNVCVYFRSVRNWFTVPAIGISVRVTVALCDFT